MSFKQRAFVEGSFDPQHDVCSRPDFFLLVLDRKPKSMLKVFHTIHF